MGNVSNAVQSSWAGQNIARASMSEHTNVTESVRRALVLSVIVLGMAVSGCTGTVTIEPTDISSVHPGAERMTVDQALGEPSQIYMSRGFTYASYRYNMGGNSEYSLFNPSTPSEMFLAVVALPLYPIIIPIGHAVVRPLERLKLRLERQAWLCVTYGEDWIATNVAAPAVSPCEPPGGLWGDEDSDGIRRSQPTPIVDPAKKARIVAYLDNNMRKFENAIRDYAAKNPDSFVPRGERTIGKAVYSYDVRQANEDRIVLRVEFGIGARTLTKLLLVQWVEGGLEVVAHRDDAQGKEASSS